MFEQQNKTFRTNLKYLKTLEIHNNDSNIFKIIRTHTYINKLLKHNL